MKQNTESSFQNASEYILQKLLLCPDIKVSM